MTLKLEAAGSLVRAFLRHRRAFLRHHAKQVFPYPSHTNTQPLVILSVARASARGAKSQP